MKKIIMFAFVLSPLLGFSQTNQASANPKNDVIRAIKVSEIDKFYGTWLYEANGQVFELILKKSTYINRIDKTIIDVVVGSHVYKVNGKLIDGNIDSAVHTIYSGFIKNYPEKNGDILNFRFGNPAKHILMTGQLKYMNGAIPKLIWTLDPPRTKSVVLKDKPIAKVESKVPSNLVLTKEQ